MPSKGKSAKKTKNQNGQKPKGKKGNGGQVGQKESRSFMNVRKFPKTYFSTEKGSEGEMIIKGHEIIGEINTSTGFTLVLNEKLSPLNPKLFPKLSAIARTFEQYHFRDLKFHFRTGTSGVTNGSVLHYVDYSVGDQPAVNAISILANQTAMVSSVTLDNTVAYDVSRQMLPKLFVGGSSSNNALGVGSLREVYCGDYRVFTDKGPATNLFAGYLYAEYTCCFWTPRPPVPVGGAGAIASILALAAASSNGLPLNVVEENVGLPGEAALGTDSTYTSKGGLVGALDYAKNIYESGKWLVGAVATLSAATMSHGGNSSGEQRSRFLPPLAIRGSDDLSVRSWATERSTCENASEEKTSSAGVGVSPPGTLPSSDWTGVVEIVVNSPDRPPLGRRPRSLEPMASGDVELKMEWYDVTNGVVDPDFPVSVNGMSYVAFSSTNYNGSTGALAPNSSTQVVVPDGKRYMFRPMINIGVTTSRTLSFYQFTSQCQTHYPG